MSHLLPDMIDKSLPSVISAKLLFRRAAAPSSTSTSSYSSSNRRSTATCLFVHSCIRGVADSTEINFILERELSDCRRINFCRTKISQTDIIMKMFRILRKERARLDLSDSSMIVVNLLRKAAVKFLRREFTSYSD